MMENEYENKKGMIREKLDFYISNKIMIHIILKDKRFLNAIIIKKVNENIYEIREKKFGSMHLFVSDVYEIREYLGGGR